MTAFNSTHAQEINSAVKFSTSLISSNINQESTKPSLSDLGKLLRKKNDHFEIIRENKRSTNQGRQQASMKASLPKLQQLKELTEKVRRTTRQFIAKGISNQEKEQQFKKLINEIWFDDLTLENQSEYLAAHNQYQIKKLISESMNENPKAQKSMKRQNFNRIHKITQKQQIEHLHSAKIIANKSQNRIKYLNFIKNSILNDEGITNISQFTQLVDCEFWQIIASQLKNYQYAKSQKKKNPEIAIVLASLRLIEKQFKKKLLDNQNSINASLIREKIQTKRQKDYFYDNKGLLRWGLAYTYYKTGSYAKFLSKISESGRHGTELRKSFEDLQQSIEQLNPQGEKQFIQSDIQDPFYQQLVYILRGQMNFSSPTLCQPNTLDFVWLVLRVVQMFKYESKESQAYRKSVFNNILLSLEDHIQYSQQSSSETFKNLLYLNAYELMIKLTRKNLKKSNKIKISEDDYMHLLLVLYFHPELTNMAGSSSPTQMDKLITNELSDYLVSFITKILYGDKSQLEYAVYYILMIPISNLTQSYSRIFTNLDIFKKIDEIIIDGVRGWQYIQYKVELNTNSQQEKHTFIRAIFQIFDNMLVQESDPQQQYRIVRKSQRFFREDKQLFHEFTIKAICKFLTQRQNNIRKNMNSQNSTKYNQIVLDYFQLLNQINLEDQYEDITEDYSAILEFLKVFCYVEDLSSSLKTKDIKKLVKFLDEEKYVSQLEYLLPSAMNQYQGYPNKNHPLIYLKQILMNLSKQQCTILFAIFIKRVIQMQMFVMNKKGRFEQNKEYQEYILNLLQELSSNEQKQNLLFKKSQKEKELKKMMQTLFRNLIKDLEGEFRIY